MNKIKEYREKAGLTQEAVARQLEISLRYYISLEKGTSEPSVYKAIRLSIILQVDVRELFPLPPEDEVSDKSSLHLTTSPHL